MERTLLIGLFKDCYPEATGKLWTNFPVSRLNSKTWMRSLDKKWTRSFFKLSVKVRYSTETLVTCLPAVTRAYREWSPRKSRVS